jgi:AraC-like DNA-binding protein
MKIVFEKIVTKADSSFAILDKRASAFDGRFHFHPEFEITLIESSSGRRVVGDSIEPFAPGDLVLLGENLPHQYVSDPGSRQKLAEAKVIQFRADVLGEGLLHLPEFDAVSSMLKRSSRGLKFSHKTVQAARQIISQIFNQPGLKRLLGLLELLDALARDGGALPIASAGYLSKLNSREGAKIDKALRYLNQTFQEPLTARDVCRHLHVSPATCNRLFQKSVGRSFKTALIEMRISHACRLLLETERPIVDIAYASGFTNLSNFNRRFKEMKGHTPRTYRNLTRPKDEGGDRCGELGLTLLRRTWRSPR